MDSLGKRLHAARRNNGMSMRDLAARAGCTYGLISQIETGVNKKTYLIPKFASILGCDPMWLAEGSGSKSATPSIKLETKCHNAHSYVAKAIRDGYLARPSTLTCIDCGQPAEVYDHRDYNKPLTVEPVCHACNLNRGPGISFVHVNDR